MSLRATNLVIQMAPIPATFHGTPNDLMALAVRRMQIVSPNGANFIFIGDTEPTSNVGPWLKDGTKWYVWSDETKRYVPLDISDSLTLPYWSGNTVPPSTPPYLWLFTTKDATDIDPSLGTPIGWYFFDGANWIPFNSITLSGPTATRPGSPVEYQQYYDTDIAALLWWERAAWRTVSGVPGDVKAVAYETLTVALTHNPGWEVFGRTNQHLRGRIVMEAAKDSGATPETVLSVDPGIAQRAAFETFGETDGVQIAPASPVPYPPQLALWHLVKT